MKHLKQFNPFPYYLSHPLFRPLVGMAALSFLFVSMALYRFLHGGDYGYLFLIWNLFLAWLPVPLAYLVRMHYKPIHWLQWVSLLATTFLWLIFFPNSPYIITDFIHVEGGQSVSTWGTGMVYFGFALTGLFTGIISLHWVVQKWQEAIGKQGTLLFLAIVLISSGYGIYIGRVLRWNSWDIITRPIQVLIDSLAQMSDPLAWRMTFVFALVLSVVYFAFLTLTGYEQPRTKPQ